MAILGVEKLIYGAADLQAGIKFQHDWGLICKEEDDTGAVFDLLDGSQVVIRSSDDQNLPPAKVDWAPWGHSTVREAVWGIDNEHSLQNLVDDLSTDRSVNVDAFGVAHTQDDYGYPIAFCLSKRQTVETSLPKTNSFGHFQRYDEQSPGSFREKAVPIAFSHLVYWIADDPQKYKNFYIDRLGFRQTDQISDGSCFLQASGRTDHHNLFLQHSKDGYSGFQHISYEYKDFDAVMMLGIGMEAKGWKTNVGPLRHNIGSSLSWYIWNPAGGVAEALTDQDQMSDDWQARSVDTSDPDFYGHAWVARKEHVGIGPAQWVDD